MLTQAEISQLLGIDAFPEWERFGVHNELPVYVVYPTEIRNWVESQSSDLWKPYIYGPRDYVFSKELELLFLLRWS